MVRSGLVWFVVFNPVDLSLRVRGRLAGEVGNGIHAEAVLTSGRGGGGRLSRLRCGRRGRGGRMKLGEPKVDPRR